MNRTLLFCCSVLLFTASGLATAAFPFNTDDSITQLWFDQGRKVSDPSDGTFIPDPVDLQQPSTSSQQPLYFFLFTHTEDPFNHDLSEERYLRFVPEVEARTASHPDANLTWTIMFQGTDARAVVERNPQTGVLDLLREAAAKDVVQFGYHAHHDATYANRPQNGFTENSTWEELSSGMLDWVSCLKDVNYGGCLESTGGGLYAVTDNFGPVQAVSGDFMVSELAYEGGPSTWTVSKILPERSLSFGFPDHGPFASGARRDAVAQLMALLTPTQETSSTVFWADNVIKMTGGSPIDGTRGIDPLRGPAYAEGMLAGLDRTRPNLVLTGIASKFLYTKQIPNNSPTIYGYSHPEAPQLPTDLLNTPQQQEQFYQQSLDTLDYLLDEVLVDNPGSVFLDSKKVTQMVAPPSYWQIEPDQLDRLARWAVTNWDSRPPDWVSDGTDFYSLRDLFTLLVRALGEGDATGDVSTLELEAQAYGPLQGVDAEHAVTLSRQEILQIAAELAPDYSTGGEWQLTPSAMVRPEYQTSVGNITAAQLLYGLAWIYAADYADATVESVTLPATQAMPVTYDYLLQIGCLATCTGTAWSFKPARLVDREIQTGLPEAYTLFSVNVQDFSYPDESAAVLNKILDLHEETGVPVDIYLTDEMALIFAQDYPALLTRLKTSPVVAISYHTRLPRPYTAYDWAGLGNMSASRLYQTILDYETHAVDAVTGETTSETGGYASVADLVGYLPYAASALSPDGALTSTARQVYSELGARMTITHGGVTNLGDSVDGLYRRPEHVDYRLFEHVGENPESAFEDALAQAQTKVNPGDIPFVGLKIHDNDFFATESAWVTVYLNHGRHPPWNPELKASLLSNEERTAVWNLYEDTVRYVAAQHPRVEALNLSDVQLMLLPSPPSGLCDGGGVVQIPGAHIGPGGRFQCRADSISTSEDGFMISPGGSATFEASEIIMDTNFRVKSNGVFKVVAPERFF